MSKKISKHIKAVYTCKNCRKKFTTRFIIDIPEVSVAAIKPHVYLHLPTSCKKCGYNSFVISFAFYHEEKITK